MNELLRDAYAAVVADAPPAPDLPGAAPHPAARRRRLPAPVVALAAAALVLAVVGLPWLVIDRSAGRDAASAVPAATWRQGAPPPFSPRMVHFSGTLSDGRLLFWGGDGLPFAPEGHPGDRHLDGGIYDPVTDEWTSIPPPAFLPQPATVEAESVSVALAEDRLAVLLFGGPLVGGVYDAAAGTWTEITAAPGIEVVANGVAWTGDTLVLLRLSEGEPAWTIDEPVTLRWTLDTQAWEDGAEPPLTTRFGAGVAHDGERIAVWGGTETNIYAPIPDLEYGAATAAGVVADGAIYDIGADSWTPMPPAPFEGRVHPTVVWIDEGLFVGGGSPSLEGGVGEQSPYPGGVYHPESGTWSRLPPPPALGEFVLGRRPVSGEQLLTTGSLVAHSGAQPAQYWIGGTWVDTPTYDLHYAGDLLLATTRTSDNPDDVPFRVHALVDGTWGDLGGAPFTNRMDAGIATGDDVLVVVDGAVGRNLDAVADTWVLDLHG